MSWLFQDQVPQILPIARNNPDVAASDKPKTVKNVLLGLLEQQMARITTHSRLPCKLYRYQERNPFVEGELEILFRDQSCSNCFYAQ